MTAVRRLRLALALADAGLATALQAALEADGHEVRRCLAAGALFGAARADDLDAALVGADLYQLTRDGWDELIGRGVRLVLRADPAEAPHWPGPAALVGPDADADALRGALLAMAAGTPPVRPLAPPAPAAPAPVAELGVGVPALGRVIAFGGPPGGGRTTVAANFAIALELVARVAFVDADCACACAAPMLDADVGRNLATLAHADPRDAGAWERALARDGQPLRRGSDGGLLLCGLSQPEQRGVLGRAFFDRLLAELRRRFAYVVLDVGSDVLGAEGAIHRAALLAADDVLFVARADALGLWQARAALGVWERQLRLPAGRVALVLNQHDARRGQGAAQIGWALRTPVAAVLPEDRAAAERALLTHEPLLFARRSRLAAAILELADRVHGGQILLPADPTPTPGRFARLRGRLARHRSRRKEGAPGRDGDALARA